jgi:ABC-type transport system involved in multi-copper enzyme maturation permease subunit
LTGNVGAVFLFEWKRALTVPRMAWWGVLAGFPVMIIGLVRYLAKSDLPRELWVGLFFALIPMLVSMLGTLLWTSPAISAELERRSWVYLTIRPNGATAVLLGKYLAAVTWVIPAALVGLSIAVPLASTDDSWQIWWTMARLVCLSCPAYAAIYLLLGVVLPRRGMVLGVAYSLIFELVISFIPAVINQITVQYRLRALLVQWADLPVPRDNPTGVLAIIGNAPPWHHVTTLIILTVVVLVVATAVLRASEFSSSAESDN